MTDNIVLEHTDTKATTANTTAPEAPKEGFFKRHKNKFKVAGYTTLAGAVITGGYFVYKHFTGAANSVE